MSVPWIRDKNGALIRGFYDRDQKTRLIRKLYIERKDMLTVSYRGTIQDLIRSPNFGKYEY